MPGKLLEEDNTSPSMPTTPKQTRPIPVTRRTVHDSNVNSEMGRSVHVDNPYEFVDPNRQTPTHMMSQAMKTPEQDRRKFPMSSPSPAVYTGGHAPPKHSPVVRPQSAMALTSPSSSNSYMNNYGKIQYARPPSSLGLTSNHAGNRMINHQHSRSYGDGVTSEKVFTDGIPPRQNISNDAYSVTPPKPHQDQKRIQAVEQNLYKPPQAPRVYQGSRRGSYNPHYASHLDMVSRTDTQRDEMNPPHVGSVQDSGNNDISKSKPVNSSQDLRSAWQRLYGQGAELAVRRPSVDLLTHTNQPTRTEDTPYQTSPRQENRSPQLNRDNMQPPVSPMFPRDRQVAGPMVVPFANSGRQSPPGQCSTTQYVPQVLNSTSGPTSVSSPKSALKTYKPITHDSQSLGPASKYPDPDMGLRNSTKLQGSPRQNETRNYSKIKQHTPQTGRRSPQKCHHKEMNESRESGLNSNATRFTHNHAFCSNSENENDEPDILPTDSIFDYVEDNSDEDSIAQLDKTLKGSQHILDSSLQKNEKGNNVVHIREAAKSMAKHQDLKTLHYARTRSLEDVRESGDESNNLSFDVENTFLMVEPSDQSEMGTLRSKNSDVKTKLNRLEGMYSKVMKVLETRSPQEPRSRRWSIGSSDTNSLRHQVHHTKHGRSSAQKMGGREIKSINKRFQRLESHVITLARSIAHISSELRTQTTMTREIENVKREIQELKVTGSGNGGNERRRHDFDKYRGYNHPLTNPRQVNKLTRFFGQEPSWLEIFLTRLGYEQYVKNFDQEHIGMMELPYMTDDQLKSIGIPMGPRTRILQESQMCFKDDNFNIYIV